MARGKSSNHIASNNSCETCHTTNAWAPARFDHVAVAGGTCASCHNGLRASGLPVNHIPTAQQCDSCHGTLGWKPAKLDHRMLTVNCASCHNNAIALGQSATHMSTQRDCATCHSYADWAAIAFRHVSANYPGDHKAVLTCASCHTSNSDQVPYASPADTGACASCHARDYKPPQHPKTSDGQPYSASELGNCTGACHVYSDATMSTIVKTVSGPYHRVTDAAFRH
jgi:hypothetical protein